MVHTEKPPIKLAILICGSAGPELTAKHGDFADMVINLFHKANENNDNEFKFDLYNVQDRKVILSPNVKKGLPTLREAATYDGILLTGSSSSVYDDEQWIKDLKKFVADVHAIVKDTKLLGICFGHQMISYALGGDCKKNPKGWEFGYTQGWMTSQGKNFFANFTTMMKETHYMRLNQIHQDEVPEVPPDFTLLATNDPHTHVHAMTSNDRRCLSFQGHPEFTREFIRDLVNVRLEKGKLPKDQYAEQQVYTLRKGTLSNDNLWVGLQFTKFLQGNLRLGGGAGAGAGAGADASK
ncbi:hypothetical protein DFQ29_008534 [Apophysomyces sp. BC1021]|nr:hypothetical protein DFQ29_008534 [Apophysomyces sp. BC1021]